MPITASRHGRVSTDQAMAISPNSVAPQVAIFGKRQLVIVLAPFSAILHRLTPMKGMVDQPWPSRPWEGFSRTSLGLVPRSDYPPRS